MKISIDEFKKTITKMNERKDVHVKVLSRKLGDAIKNNRCNVAWFNEGEKLAQITIKGRTFTLFVSGKFFGELINESTGEIEDMYHGAFQETENPVSIRSDDELDKILDASYNGYQIRYLDASCLVLSDGKTCLGCRTFDTVKAILDVDFYISEIENADKNGYAELDNLIFECKDYIRLAKGNFERALDYMSEAEKRIKIIERDWK